MEGNGWPRLNRGSSASVLKMCSFLQSCLCLPVMTCTVPALFCPCPIHQVWKTIKSSEKVVGSSRHPIAGSFIMGNDSTSEFLVIYTTSSSHCRLHPVLIRGSCLSFAQTQQGKKFIPPCARAWSGFRRRPGQYHYIGRRRAQSLDGTTGNSRQQMHKSESRRYCLAAGGKRWSSRRKECPINI